MDKPNQYNVAIVGDGGVGKTTFINLLRNTPIGVIAPPVSEKPIIQFDTNHGLITFNILDTIEQLSSIDVETAVIIMFDMISITSVENLGKWIEKIKGLDSQVLVVICGNKLDKLETISRLGRNYAGYSKFLDTLEELELYHSISAKFNYNCKKPFLHIMKHMINGDIRIDKDVY